MSKILLIAASLLMISAHASAADFEMNGRASVPAAGDPQSIKTLATRAAKRQAVQAGLNRMIGPDAAKDPAVQAKIQEITDNIKDAKIVDAKGTRIGADYEMTVTIVMDDKEFRTLISDAGIASNTAGARTGAKILAVMDEFLTTPKNLKQPLEELVEFRAEKGKSFSDKSVAAKSSSAAMAASANSSSSVDAAAASRTKVDASYDSKLSASGKQSAAAVASDGSGSVGYGASREANVNAQENARLSGESASAASYRERNASSASMSAAASSSSISAKNVASEEHDNVHYKKLVKYQPQSTAPEKVSQTYNAMVNVLNQYDLQVADNDMFKSKYFKNKPITIEQMQNSEQLAKYVSFARDDAKADYFMVGTSIIIDSGTNPNTGNVTCTGVATAKTFATVGGESIASTTVSEAAEGRNLNECGGNLAIKLAEFAGGQLGAAVQQYTKRRTTYGSEFIVTLFGKGLNAMTKAQFTKALKAVQGVAGSKQRESSDSQLEFAVSYKGDGSDLTNGLVEGLMGSPVFSNLDSGAKGNQLYFCMGSCKQVKK